MLLYTLYLGECEDRRGDKNNFTPHGTVLNLVAATH
jgi:hypothetical protein